MGGIVLLFHAVALLEALNSSGCIDQLLFSREKRVTARAHFQPDLLLGRSRFKFVPAGAGDKYLVVFRMNSFSHFVLVARAHPFWSARSKNVNYSRVEDVPPEFFEQSRKSQVAKVGSARNLRPSWHIPAQYGHLAFGRAIPCSLCFSMVVFTILSLPVAKIIDLDEGQCPETIWG